MRNRGDRTPPWRPPQALGARPGLEAITGVAAPLLAGFGITLTAVVVTDGDEAPWSGIGVLASVSSVVLLVAAVQFGAWARHYSATPDDLRIWFEDFKDESEYYGNLLARHDHLYSRYAGVARIAYGIGIVMLLLALALIVSPPSDANQYAARIVASIAATLGAAAETVWILVTFLDDKSRLPARLRRLRRHLLPRLEDVPPPERSSQ